jgi:superfamily II RNA helicase
MPPSDAKSTSDFPLLRYLPGAGQKLDSGDLLDRFLAYLSDKGVELYPAQEEAILALYEGRNVILNTPTGSGKSLVATALHFHSLAHGRRSVYTCPIKALVNEKFLALCAEFGPDQVGMTTGDATVNRDAPILCCTAEILSNMALREGPAAPAHDVIMDEFHYYSDRERGVAWQVPLLTLSYARFLLMSATLGDTAVFEQGLTKVTGLKTLVVRSNDRPVPLDFVYSETALHEAIRDLVFGGKAPVYLVSFTQRECAEEAQNLLSIDICTKDEKKVIAAALEGVKFSSPYGKEVQKLLRHGIGLHHAGLLPKYRLLVERLAQQGLLKVICGTDTLGVGVNVPIRTVLFTKLCKFDGEKTVILSVRDFLQISGRAGRKGFDDRGRVVVQAPEHVIENKYLEAKAGGDAKKLRRITRKKPPEKGYLHWDENTFKRLLSSPPEALQSRFQVTHGMLLNVLGRPGDGCKAMKDLIRGSYESATAKRQHTKTGFQLFRSLLDRGLLEVIPKSERDGAKVRVKLDLQEDFSLNHALSLYLIDTIKLLDPVSPDYALDLLTLVESILENPDLILRKQLDRLKGQKVFELKAAGVEYDERMAELEKLEYPKPNRDFIYDSFNAFAVAHPWVGKENIRPKSIARDMYEQFMTFEEYIRDYDLQRAEGLLLRYLSEAYKVLVQTVPESERTEEIMALMVYFGDMIRRIDASLLEEWEKMRRPGSAVTSVSADDAEVETATRDITRDKRAMTALVRNEVFRLLRLFAVRDYEAAAAALVPVPSGGGDADNVSTVWTATALEAAWSEFYLDHDAIATDPKARNPQYLKVTQEVKWWQLEQIVPDRAGHNDWLLHLTVDVERSREAGQVFLGLRRLAAI